MSNPYFTMKITSDFGPRDNPLNPGEKEFHRGIDFTDPQNRVYPGLSGNARVGYGSREGNFIQVQQILYNTVFYANSFHNKEILVQTGDKVLSTDIVAVMGATGTVTGKHVHHEVFTYDLQSTFVDELKKVVAWYIDTTGKNKRIFFHPLRFYRYLEEKVKA
jgi:murein DD-endopeptidase MepM/ murein hydrolase activator NlpD